MGVDMEEEGSIGARGPLEQCEPDDRIYARRRGPLSAKSGPRGSPPSLVISRGHTTSCNLPRYGFPDSTPVSSVSCSAKAARGTSTVAISSREIEASVQEALPPRFHGLGLEERSRKCVSTGGRKSGLLLGPLSNPCRAFPREPRGGRDGVGGVERVCLPLGWPRRHGSRVELHLSSESQRRAVQPVSGGDFSGGVDSSVDSYVTCRSLIRDSDDYFHGITTRRCGPACHHRRE